MKLSTVFGAASLTCITLIIGAQYHIHESHPTCAQASEWSFWLLFIGFFSAVGWLFAKIERT